jgi:hypothetical protein
MVDRSTMIQSAGHRRQASDRSIIDHDSDDRSLADNFMGITPLSHPGAQDKTYEGRVALSKPNSLLSFTFLHLIIDSCRTRVSLVLTAL